jgi:hypothetical protein
MPARAGGALVVDTAFLVSDIVCAVYLVVAGEQCM